MLTRLTGKPESTCFTMLLFVGMIVGMLFFSMGNLFPMPAGRFAQANSDQRDTHKQTKQIGGHHKDKDRGRHGKEFGNPFGTGDALGQTIQTLHGKFQKILQTGGLQFHFARA